MADIFVKSDANKLLAWKHILIIGDSNMRALYKDLICILTSGKLLTLKQLRAKGEDSFLGDKRSKFISMNRTRDFVEDRYIVCKDADSGVCVKLEFIFTTKVYNQSIIDRFTSQKRDLPDIVLINSIVWDLTRWGPEGDIQFKFNLIKLVELFRETLPSSSLVVWLTAQHLSSRETTTALVVKELDFLNTFLQHHIVEANTYAAFIMRQHGFNVLDSHYYSRLMSHRRRPDGVHYSCTAVRFHTNLVLTHIALTWRVKLPGRQKSWEIEYALAAQEHILDECETLCGKVEAPYVAIGETLDSNGGEPDGHIERGLEETRQIDDNVQTLHDKEEILADNEKIIELIDDKAKAVGGHERIIDGKKQLMNSKDKLDDDQEQVIDGNEKTIGGKEQVIDGKDKLLYDQEQVIDNNVKKIDEDDKVIDDKVRTIDDQESAINNVKKIDEDDKVIDDKVRTIDDQESAINNVKKIDEDDKVIDDKVRTIDDQESAIDDKVQFIDNEKSFADKVQLLESEDKAIDHKEQVTGVKETEVQEKTIDDDKNPPRKILRAKRRLRVMEELDIRANTVVANTVDDLMNEIDWQMADEDLGWFSVFGPDY